MKRHCVICGIEIDDFHSVWGKGGAGFDICSIHLNEILDQQRAKNNAKKRLNFGFDFRDNPAQFSDK